MPLNLADALTRPLAALAENGGAITIVHHGGGDWSATMTTPDHPHDAIASGYSPLEVVAELAKDLP